MFHLIAKAFSSVVLGVSSLLGIHHTAVISPVATTITTVQIESTTTAPLPAVAKPVLQKVAVPTKMTTQTSVSTGTTVTTPVVAPPGTLSCNGSFWKSQYVCPSGQELVCPATGNPVCQWTAASQTALKEQADIEAANKAKAEAANAASITAVKDSCNAQIKTLSQQIIDIKSQYYKDSAALNTEAIPMEFIQGRQNQLLADMNTKIAQIQLQIDQVNLNCS